MNSTFLLDFYVIQIIGYFCYQFASKVQKYQSSLQKVIFAVAIFLTINKSFGKYGSLYFYDSI